MIGAIIGDIAGSPFEGRHNQCYDFPFIDTERGRFTDDSVLTVATAECLLNHGNYDDYYKRYGKLYPECGFSHKFKLWIYFPRGPYNSAGNGSAMRVSAIGYFYATLEETLYEAERSAAVSHNHPDGIKGAKAIAATIFLLRNGAGKADVKSYITETFGYNLNQTLQEIRPCYTFDATCNGTVPQAFIAFLESCDYEDAVRLAVSLGGDTDTLACMAGALAEAYYKKIGYRIIRQAWPLLPEQMRRVIVEFKKRFKESKF